MSEFEVDGLCNDTEVEVQESLHDVDIIETVSEANVKIENVFTVEAQINEWQLVNDMFYVVQEFGEIPDWLQTAIEEILHDPEGLLIDSLKEMKRLFDQFEEGYESRVISLETSDESQNTHITSLISRTDENAAGIVHIEDTYASKDYAYAVSTEVVGAYLNDGALGGAWFERSVSAVADVAYSAARSASSLNASIRSNAEEISSIYGTLEDLSRQVDGQIITWFVSQNDPGNGEYYDPIGPVLPDGTINPNGKPYWCWTPGNECPDPIYNDKGTTDVRAEHTGDTYVYFEYDAYGNKAILSTWRFVKDPDTGEYNWVIFTDDLASEAYQKALNAQVTADGKINTFFQTWAPTLADAGLVAGDAWKMDGDIWYDATIIGTDDQGNPIYDGTMRRYNGKLPGGGNNPNWSADNWKEVSDQRIDASVKRLDEATVDIDGTAVAKATLIVEATGGSGETAVVGYQASATSDNHGAQRKFRIFADNFEVASTLTSLPVFYVDAAKNKVGFRANVTFEHIPYFEDKFTQYDYQFYKHSSDIADIEHAGYITAVDVNPNVTSIDGGVIKTGYVQAARIATNSLSALSANLGVVNAGVMYNSGANSSNYTFMINLNSGEIHIR